MLDLKQELDQHIVADCLACPVCRAPLRITDDARSVVCTGTDKAHCFDGGAGGYLPLSPRHTGGGDSKEAVRARSGYLNRGYYQPAAEALCRAAQALCPTGGDLLDAGCGEGYYSNRLAASGFCVLGVDLSKYAVDSAAKAARAQRLATPDHAPSRTVYAVGSVFALPVHDASFDLVTNIFAPCAPSEFCRVLKPGGFLIVAGAGERHLMGLKRILYDDPYVNEGRRDLPDHTDPTLRAVDRQSITFTATVRGAADIAALFSMTPYYWRTSPESRSRLEGLQELETEVSFDFFIYRKV